MPITRRRRANPPDQPENNNNHAAGHSETPTNAEALPTERPAEASAPGEAENNAISSVPPTTPASSPARTEGVPFQPTLPASLSPATNGERAEQHNERPEYTPTIEAGRRTARGELFRRPPQVPVPQTPVPAMASAAPLQAPTHEINLPLGNLLHLAYNPSYTGSDEARSTLLHQLAHDSKAGGRGRCWSCGSLAIAYDYWNTRSKNFGEVGVAFCEICGVWSVM